MSSRSSRTDRPRDLPETVIVGQIRKPHGLRGEVVVEILSDVPDRFVSGRALRMVAVDGSARERRIEKVRVNGSRAIVLFDGSHTRDDAEALRGRHLEVSRRDVPGAEAGSYYQYELLGCVCSDVKAGELGEVVGLVEDGGGILLRVSRDGETVLVPFVAAFVEHIDIEAGTISVALPEGLIETCTFRS